MDESSGVISEIPTPIDIIPSIKPSFLSSIMNNTYIYMLLAVLIICGIVYFMYNKTFNEIGNIFNSKKQEVPQLQPKGNTYYINDINGNKILVSGTLISEPEKNIIKPKIIHPRKETLNFEDVQIDEDEKTKLHNLTNSEMNEIHQKLENIEY